MAGRRLEAVPQPPRAISKKRAAWLKVAPPRLSNLLHDIEVLAITADRNRYDVDDSDVEKIIAKIQPAINGLFERFRTGRRKPLIEFD